VSGDADYERVAKLEKNDMKIIGIAGNLPRERLSMEEYRKLFVGPNAFVEVWECGVLVEQVPLERVPCTFLQDGFYKLARSVRYEEASFKSPAGVGLVFEMEPPMKDESED
jgi:hypothetical protein